MIALAFWAAIPVLLIVAEIRSQVVKGEIEVERIKTWCLRILFGLSVAVAIAVAADILAKLAMGWMALS